MTEAISIDAMVSVFARLSSADQTKMMEQIEQAERRAESENRTLDEISPMEVPMIHEVLYHSTCVNCNSLSANSVCARCKTARYCSRACQTASWPVHKHTCASILGRAGDNIVATDRHEQRTFRLVASAMQARSPTEDADAPISFFVCHRESRMAQQLAGMWECYREGDHVVYITPLDTARHIIQTKSARERATYAIALEQAGMLIIEAFPDNIMALQAFPPGPALDRFRAVYK